MALLFDPEIWGPHYWFFLHTVAETYPNTPNPVTKRKYYDLIQNFPLFIPVEEMGNKFSDLLDKYPVTPYLDSRESFVRWVHFIHNKCNSRIGKKEYSLAHAIDLYRNQYSPRPIYLSEKINLRKKHIYTAIIMICMVIIIIYYDDR